MSVPTTFTKYYTPADVEKLYRYLCDLAGTVEYRPAAEVVARELGMHQGAVYASLRQLQRDGRLIQHGERNAASYVIVATGAVVPRVKPWWVGSAPDEPDFPRPTVKPEVAMKGVTFEDDPRAVLAETNGPRLGNAPSHVATQSALADA